MLIRISVGWYKTIWIIDWVNSIAWFIYISNSKEFLLLSAYNPKIQEERGEREVEQPSENIVCNLQQNSQ